jgi:hypothetical protein
MRLHEPMAVGGYRIEPGRVLHRGSGLQARCVTLHLFQVMAKASSREINSESSEPADRSAQAVRALSVQPRSLGDDGGTAGRYSGR